MKQQNERGASVGIVLLIIAIIVILGLLIWAFWRAQTEQEETTPEPTEPFSTTIEDVGFATPESVIHDAESDVYLVSNINGAPTEADQNGFISQVSPEGEVTELNWIQGGNELDLSAPKGMAIVDDSLYVSDINVVHVFDKNSGEHQSTIPITGATFLNDVAASEDGTIYVSDSGLDANFEDTGTDAIYTITEGEQVDTLVADTALENPNGIAVHSDGEQLMTVSYGGNSVFHVNADGSFDETAQLPEGSLDGIVWETVDSSMLVSSWDGGSIYQVDHDTGESSVVFDDLTDPADIGMDENRERVLIPLFSDDAVSIRSLE